MWYGTIVEPEEGQEQAVEAQRGVLQQGAKPVPRKGERAAQIRYLHDKYPEMSNAALARRVGCTEGNVTSVLKTFMRDLTREQLAEFQAGKADIFDSLQLRTLASITDTDIAKASYSQRIVGAAILEDKARLVRGQATSINVNALLDVAELLRQERDK